MTPLSSTDNESQLENGNADDKLPLKNGIGDKTQIIESIDRDRTDDAPRQEEKPLSPIMYGCKKRKYKIYDNGKRSRLNLSPLTSSSVRFEQKIKDKTGLTRTGLVLVILCILLAIALFLCIILWPKTAHSKQYPICTKPSCLRSSAEILPKLNLSESPCSNYRSYACGNWLSSNPLPKDRSEWNLKELLQLTYRRKIHELLVTTPVFTSSATTSLSWKLKNFYDSCMDLDEINLHKEEPLKRLINKLGGWQVLSDGFTIYKWDTYKVLETLHSSYQVSPYFRIDVVPNGTNSKHNVVRLRPPLLGLPDTRYYQESESHPVIASYMRFMKDIVLLFGATAVDAGQFSQDLVYYEKRIAQLLEKSRSNQTDSVVKLKITELKAKLKPIPIYDILLGTLPNANWNDNSEVLIWNFDYFQALPTLLSTSDNISLNKYLIWRLVQEYVPYLSEKYVKTLQIFREEFLGQSEPVPRWEFCISTLQKFAGFGLLAMFENKLEDKLGIDSVVSQIFTETLHVIKADFESKTKRSEGREMLDKLKNVTIRIGFPSNMLKQDYIDSYYNSFNAIRKDFFQNILYGVTHVNDNLERQLTNPQDEYRWLNDMISQPVSVSYNPAANLVIVPSAILQSPFFEKDYPLTSLYGGLGREIASAIVTSLILSKSHGSPTRTERKDSVRTISECALNQNVAQSDYSDKETFVVSSVGVKYAYKSLVKELAMGEHSHQPAMETFENEELFFMFYAQSTCTKKTGKRLNNDMNFSKSMTDITLTNSVLAQLPEFTDLYSCDSPKNTRSLCNI